MLDVIKNKDEKKTCFLNQAKKYYATLQRHVELNELVSAIAKLEIKAIQFQEQEEYLNPLLVEIAELNISISVLYEELGDKEKQKNALLTAQISLKKLPTHSEREKDLLEEIQDSIAEVKKKIESDMNIIKLEEAEKDLNLQPSRPTYISQ